MTVVEEGGMMCQYIYITPDPSVPSLVRINAWGIVSDQYIIPQKGDHIWKGVVLVRSNSKSTMRILTFVPIWGHYPS